MSRVTASIVIPAFGRVEPLKYTLRSAAAAARSLGEPAEIILVDDGSSPPLADALAEFDSLHAVRILRQNNAGSIVARLAGLAAATGDFVQFLDSDDLIHPEKLSRHIATMRAESADISYSDTAAVKLGTDYSASDYRLHERLRSVSHSVELLLRVQPLPHSPVYCRDYLRRALSAPVVPPRRAMDPAGDVWLYYNLSVHPAKVCKVADALSAIGPHDELRYSHHWEKLGFAALQIMEAFTERCPATAAHESARCTVGACAFATWRSLPRGYHPAIEARTLAVWRRLPRAPLAALGGPFFRRCARLLGAETAGRLFRLRQHCYESCRTLPPDELSRLVGRN